MTDECVSECPEATASVGFAGDVCAEPSVLPCCGGRGDKSLALLPPGTGIASDFQYVSTAPPISNLTPLKGDMILTSKETCLIGQPRRRVIYHGLRTSPMTCKRGSKMGSVNGSLFWMFWNNDGSAVARPIVFVPKLGYSENSKERLSGEETWKVNTIF